MSVYKIEFFHKNISKVTGKWVNGYFTNHLNQYLYIYIRILKNMKKHECLSYIANLKTLNKPHCYFVLVEISSMLKEIFLIKTLNFRNMCKL